MSDRLHTSYPGVDPRFPHFASVLGAQPLINQPERTVEEALSDAPVERPSGEVRTDPWPEVSVGVGTAALSGALIGGVAAGSWTGAGIGAGANTGAWSAFTLFNAWRHLGPRARAVLTTSLVLGASSAVLGVWLRNRS